MRVMARDARIHGVVSDRIDLWKPARPGRIVGVADGAKSPFSGCRRLDLEVLNVLLSRSVAGCAKQCGVIPGDRLAVLFIVAVGTQSGTRKADFFCEFPLNRGLLVEFPIRQRSRKKKEPERNGRNNKHRENDRQP
jgi:hypothetical protein